MKLSYFKNRMLEETAAAILTESQRKFYDGLPRSEEFADHLRDTIKTMEREIDNIRRMLLLFDLCTTLGEKIDEALCYPDSDDYDPSRVARRKA